MRLNIGESQQRGIEMRKTRGQKDGSVVKKTFCSCRRPRSNLQHPHVSTEPSVLRFQVIQCFLLGLCGLYEPAYTWCTCTEASTHSTRKLEINSFEGEESKEKKDGKQEWKGCRVASSRLYSIYPSPRGPKDSAASAPLLPRLMLWFDCNVPHRLMC